MRKHGFTLIELLVVVSVIALLIALLLPALQMADTTARITICAGNERQIAIATHTFALDHDAHLPRPSTYHPGTTAMFPWDGKDDFTRIYHEGYLPDRRALFCPDGAWPGPDVPLNTSGHPNSTFFRYFNNYGWYMLISYDYFANVKPYPGVYDDIPQSLNDPADWVLMVDHSAWWQGDRRHWQQAHFAFWGSYSDRPPPRGFTRLGVNVAKMDGSVEWRDEAITMERYPGHGGGWWVHF